MNKLVMILYSFDQFKKEIEDVFKDFKDIFKFIKRYTYDLLAEKFGEFGVTVLFWGLGVAVLMVVLTKMIRH